MTGCERVLRARGELHPDGVVVRLKDLGPAALDVEITAWFETTDFAVFQRIREDVLLGFLEVIEGAGASLAGPAPSLAATHAGGPAKG